MAAVNDLRQRAPTSSRVTAKKGNLQHQNSMNDNEDSGQAGDKQTGNADEQAPAEAANQQQVTKKKKTKATLSPRSAPYRQSAPVEQEPNQLLCGTGCKHVTAVFFPT